MPTVDFTLNDLKDIFATKADLRELVTRTDLVGFATSSELRLLSTKFDVLDTKVDSIKTMLEEDIFAEAERVDNIDRRLLKVENELDRHLLEASN